MSCRHLLHLPVKLTSRHSSDGTFCGGDYTVGHTKLRQLTERTRVLNGKLSPHFSSLPAPPENTIQPVLDEDFSTALKEPHPAPSAPTLLILTRPTMPNRNVPQRGHAIVKSYPCYPMWENLKHISLTRLQVGLDHVSITSVIVLKNEVMIV